MRKEPWKFLSNVEERRGDTCGPHTHAISRALVLFTLVYCRTNLNPKFKLVRGRVTIHLETLLAFVLLPGTPLGPFGIRRLDTFRRHERARRHAIVRNGCRNTRSDSDPLRVSLSLF